MFKRLATAIFAVLFVLTSLGISQPAFSATASFKEGTDKASVLYDPLKFSKVELTKVSGGQDLTFDYLNSEDYRPANIKITLPGKAAVTLKNVGLRLKGQASRGDAKFPMKIKFDAFVKGQKFLGLKRMTLNNMVQDPSFIHEATAYKLYRSVGVPAPRTGYSRVFVQGTYFGLYLNIESIDKVFGKRWFPSTKHVYSGPYNCDIVPNNSCYEAGVGDTTRTDLENAGAIDQLSGAEWWAALGRLSNRPAVIKLMATDVFMSNWDGYTDAVKNNHFVHFDKKGRFTIIPWGLDQTFTTDSSADLTWDGSQPIFRGWSDRRSTIWEHCLAYAICHAELVKAGIAVRDTATRINLAGYMSAIAAKVNPVVSGEDDLHQTDTGSLQSYQSWIPTFLANRKEALTNFLASSSPRAISVTLPSQVKVQTKVTATVQSLWEPGVTAAYQWNLDGNPIQGATGKTYTPTPEQANGQLTFTVTLSKNSVSPTVITSPAKTISPLTITRFATPTISGTAKTGKTLTAKPGTWLTGVTKTFQWFADSTPIDGATASTYLLQQSDIGKRISVRVTGTKLGYTTLTKSSTKTSVVR
jgi:hypothetical protein